MTRKFQYNRKSYEMSRDEAGKLKLIKIVTLGLQISSRKTRKKYKKSLLYRKSDINRVQEI